MIELQHLRQAYIMYCLCMIICCGSVRLPFSPWVLVMGEEKELPNPVVDNICDILPHRPAQLRKRSTWDRPDSTRLQQCRVRGRCVFWSSCFSLSLRVSQTTIAGAMVIFISWPCLFFASIRKCEAVRRSAHHFGSFFASSPANLKSLSCGGKL